MSNPRDPFDTFDFGPMPAIVAAVSGGSDSTALLLLLKQHLDRIGSKAALLAVTVDHALRPESAEEAAHVARFAAGLGLAHSTVAWQGAKPSTGLAAAARGARYRLLAQEAARIGATVIVTGHTADDQAETVAMRGARGDGRGMAGMAPATLLGGSTWVLRPLLSTRREALRSILRESGIGWSDDPSNANPAYERVRTRAALGRSADMDMLLEGAREAAARREALGIAAAEIIATHARMVAPGLVRLAPAFATATDRDAALYALRILLSAMGGVTQLPDDARAGALLERLGGVPFCATLSRNVTEHRKDATFLLRERRGLPEPAVALPDQVWDGRFRLLRASGAGEARVSAGVLREPISLEKAPDSVPPRLIRAASATLPLLYDDEIRAGPPGWTAIPVMAPWCDFLPCFDLAPARALGALLGAAPPPDPPFAHHNVQSA